MIDYFSQNYSDKRRWMSYWHQIQARKCFDYRQGRWFNRGIPETKKH